LLSDIPDYPTILATGNDTDNESAKVGTNASSLDSHKNLGVKHSMELIIVTDLPIFREPKFGEAELRTYILDPNSISQDVGVLNNATL
jgi:hypothetical protein